MNQWQIMTWVSILIMLIQSGVIAYQMRVIRRQRDEMLGAASKLDALAKRMAKEKRP